ncbi:MAG: hypothetical protein JNK05_11070 [Myxococcales bacterium]|nr:hypothetical protein [Myxococcales bacterium]
MALRSLAWVRLTLFGGVATMASAVSAQPLDATQAAVRRSMIEDAQRAQAAGQHTQCSELALRALSMQDTGSLRRLAAECQLASGSVLEAIGNADLCISALRRDALAPGREQHLAGCERVAREARARTTRLTVRTPRPEPEGLQITISGRSLPRVEWNIATVAPTGSLVIEATARGQAPFRRTIEARSDAPAEVQIEFEPAATNTVTPPNTGTVTPPNTGNGGTQQSGSSGSNGGSSGAVTPIVAPPQAPSGGRPLVIAGGAMLGAGAVMAVVGFVVPASMLGSYRGRCSGVVDDPTFEQCDRERTSSQPVADGLTGVGFVGVGLAAVGAGLLVYGLTRGAPSAERPAPRAMVLPTFGPGSRGASLLVAF